MTAGDLRSFDESSVTVAVYNDYAAAQRAVDFLSDNKFPVHKVTIVGEDVRLVEHVLGRLTVLRAAGAGALGGAWFGLLIGFLLSLFAATAWLAVLVFSTVIGAIWGAVFGAIAHAMTGGQRDFSSIHALQAAHYGIRVPMEDADAARRLLTSLGAQNTP